ncbi:hypothetical protein [Prauserella endophytica]|uniref:DUF8175 domain-containing protein n=1 Tax=Prauserella endophytica TaxID=1592324 RepID=A0ABY2RVK0_9PSEU|nr:hypothetical protein [Prauserella endophytica]TKG61514.1 hypothetical protein FCN18_33275 [Prauserella endophytica]
MASLDNPTPSRRRPVLLAVAVVVIVVLGVAAFFWGRDSGTVAAPPPGEASPQPGTLPSSPDTAVPTTAPQDVRWELYQGVAVPMSDTHGPSSTDGAVASGYAHTPTGALIASVQIVYRLALAPADQWRAVAEQQVTGPDKAKFLAQLAEVDRGQTDPRIQQIAGFRIVSYDAQTAVIETASGSVGKYTVGTQVMRWENGDWRLHMSDAEHSTARVSPDLSGFVPWSGVK